MDRNISRAWLQEVVSRSIARPKHVPQDAVPCLAPIGMALGPSLKGHKQVIAVGSGIWGAEDPEAALGSVRALRDWLEDDRDRRIWLVVPVGDKVSPTGPDRQIAEMLRPAEDAGRFTFVRLPSEKLLTAPRLTLFGGITNEEFYDDEPKRDLLSGLGFGGCFRRHGMEDLATLWIAKHVQDVLKAPSSDVFEKLLDRLVVHRFQTGRPRDISSFFQELSDQTIDMEIQDPWIAAQTRNREKLADFLQALRQAGVTIQNLSLTWNPRNGQDTPQIQSSGLRSAASPYISNKVELKPWVPSRGQHFHDRIVHIQHRDAGGSWRVDVTSGIDNLMSYQKECNLFIEKM